MTEFDKILVCLKGNKGLSKEEGIKERREEVKRNGMNDRKERKIMSLHLKDLD